MRITSTGAPTSAPRKATASANASTHRTVKEEFYAVAFRKTFHESLDQLQADLDRFLEFYRRERAHQGYRTRGRTPYQVFVEGIEAMRNPATTEETEVKPEAA